jgi:carboxymethylenebutenolidase
MEPQILTDDDLISSMVEYNRSNQALSGFLCRPKQTEASPGILLIQEWWGLNDHIKEVAQRLAKEHYVVFAPDLYSRLGNVVTKNGAEAAKLIGSLPSAQLLSDLIDAIHYLKGLPQVDAGKAGVIGFSVGGSFALSIACRTEQIRCAVPFYGQIPPDAELGKISAPILYFYGEEDGWIQKTEVERLKSALKENKKGGEIKTYPGSPHAFFNDTRREVYNPEAAKDAWNRTLAFLKKYLKEK